MAGCRGTGGGYGHGGWGTRGYGVVGTAMGGGTGHGGVWGGGKGQNWQNWQKMLYTLGQTRVFSTKMVKMAKIDVLWPFYALMAKCGKTGENLSRLILNAELFEDLHHFLPF